MIFDFNNCTKKISIPLTNFKPGTIRIFRHLVKGMLPMEVDRKVITDKQDSIQIDSSFVGVIAGPSKDETKKYHIEYIGFPEQDVKYFQEREQKVNHV
jgi:hypothetical protein